MFKLIQKLFSGAPPAASPRLPDERPASSPQVHPSSESTMPEEEAEAAGEDEELDARPSRFYRAPERGAGDAYFATMAKMQDAIANHRYAEAAQLAQTNMGQLLPWLEEERRNGLPIGPPPSIPALGHGGTMMALVGDREGLEAMRRLVTGSEALADWTDTVEMHFEDLEIFQAILSAVNANPGCLQSEMKTLLGAEDGRRIATLISWLEKGGQLLRVREKKSYRLLLPGADVPGLEVAPPTAPAAPLRSHRAGRPALQPREIDLGALDVVPLPPSPARWTTRNSPAEVSPPIEAAFEVRDAESWYITNIAAIPKGERPDPAFRQMYALNEGLLFLDDLGRAEGVRAPAAALRYARDGRELTRAPLRYDLHRLDVNPLGHGFIAASRAGVLHAYDDDLKPLLETSLQDAPEVVALRRRLGTGPEELRGQLRSVALAPDNDRYLVTAVDEAWCLDLNGEGIWALRMPLKEGWTHVSDRSRSASTSAEVRQALADLGLELPVTPDEVKKRYRSLAKQHHPDVNRSAGAEEQMKVLSRAASVLTGSDAAALEASAGVRYRQVRESSTLAVAGISLSIELSIEGGEMSAADWIYASGFGPGGIAYLASYSGRVLVVDPMGKPVRAYDIGSVPRRIADTGDYLYLLTDTRLYVLRGDALHALVDTAEAASLIVGQAGFGLVEAKRFRWFHEDGTYLGSVISKDPIRRVYSTAEGMVVESRTRRAVAGGAPAWWAPE